MTLYRIYTEDLWPHNVFREVSRAFPGFTIFQGTGSWEGNEEPSIVIEIMAREIDAGSVLDLAERIRKLGAQNAVLVVSFPVDVVNVVTHAGT